MLEYIKLRYKLFLILVAFWFLFALNFSPETVLAGVVIPVVLTEVTHRTVYGEGQSYRSFSPWRLIHYVFFLLVGIFQAAIIFILNLIFRHYEPIVFTMQLDVEADIDVGIVANSITLTPGTITIDSNMKKRTVTVLTLSRIGVSREEVEAPIRERFERLLRRKRRDL